jgi:hypothetical protein
MKGSIYDLQRILGHTKIEMTQRYAHLNDSHLKKAASVVQFGTSVETENSYSVAIDSFAVSKLSELSVG